jgi:hypothetical protein
MRDGPRANAATDANEDDALRHCALRFDERRYLRDSGFQPQRALAAYYASGEFPEDDAERLALFAALARDLLAWGKERAPRDGREWFALRALFPEVCPLVVPPAYRRSPYHQQWEREWRPRAARLMALVKDVHEHTAYRDDALATPPA